MSAPQTQPYWLLRTPGKVGGFGTVDFKPGDTAFDAARRFVQDLDPAWRQLLLNTEAEIVLLTMVYEHDLPVYSELSITDLGTLGDVMPHVGAPDTPCWCGTTHSSAVRPDGPETARGGLIGQGEY